VLVTGASGGVGGYAVQLAKVFGAEVTGVGSAAKLDLVRALGADHVIDYRRDDFAHPPCRYDLILDLAGNPALFRLRAALRPSGTAVIGGGEGGGRWTGMSRQLRALALSPFLRQRFTTYICRENAQDLQELADLVKVGSVQPAIDRTYPLEHAPEAMAYLEAGKVAGKVVITV
jgi:NADPH:quinone reductase-like Zn-dependent oxidoreductase